MSDDEKMDEVVDEKLDLLEEKLAELKDTVDELKSHVSDKEDAKHSRRMEIIGAVAVPIVTAIVGFFLDRWFNKPPKWGH